MAKEYYEVSHKTYFNDRIKRVVFRGKEMYPLYIRVTYDRQTIFFKSYYFDLFTRPKYDYLGITLSQIEMLERKLIDFIVVRNAAAFSLDEFSRQYKLFARDVLDSSESLFKAWMVTFLEEEKLPGLGALIESAQQEVSAIQLWDEFKKSLDPGFFKKMEEKAVYFGPRYIILATYVRHKLPEGPFCLPLHELGNEATRIEMETFAEDVFGNTDIGRFTRELARLFQSKKYGKIKEGPHGR